MAAGKQNVEQTKKMIPFVTRKTSFGQNVCELVFGVNVLDLDLWVQINSVRQPIKSNSVVSGHVSHHYHFDDSLIFFKNVPLRLTLRRLCQPNGR